MVSSSRARSFPAFLLFLPVLLGALLVFFPRSGTPVSAPVDRIAPAAGGSGLAGEELLFLLQYVGSDYAAAVDGGRILDPLEYQEMLDFSRTLAAEHARIAPRDSEVGRGLERLRVWIEQKQDPVRVRELTRELVSAMTRELRLVTYPVRAPSIARGEELFAESCAQCHGGTGDGRGRSAEGQVPPPTSFREPRMKGVAPHQLYNAIGFGVDGTAMPSFDSAYSPAERWDLSFYLMTLRDDFAPDPPAAPLPLSLRDLATLSDEELSKRQGVDPGALDYYRSAVPDTPEDELLRMAQGKLEESFGAFRNGDRARAVRLSVEAYLEGIEPAETTLLALDARLVRDIERELALYRSSLREGDPDELITARLDRLRTLTERARQTLEGADRAGFGFAFVQSGAIILREGIEAALLVALLMSYLTAAGQPELRRYTLGGAFAGIAAGLATWFGAQFLVQATTLGREALEGITSLLAAGVLFSVSFWVLQHADVKRWKSYIEERARTALGAGSGFALATVSFLAVYREAFETVLFYQALWLRSGNRAGGAILLGLAAGLLALLVVVLLMFRYGRRIPLKPFFAVTGVLLALLSFVFAGYGVAELQKIGWIHETPLPWVPYVPFLELQPTLEGLSLQLGIFLSFVLSWFLAGRGGEKPRLREARV